MSQVAKIYEQAQDRYNEKQVLDEIERITGMRYKRMKQFDKVDALFLKRDEFRPKYNPYAYVEVKCRNIEFGGYPDYRISTIKHNAALDIAHTTKTRVRLVVSFKDGIWWANLLAKYEIGEISRVDRDDDRDTEECIIIPWGDFHKIELGGYW